MILPRLPQLIFVILGLLCLVPLFCRAQSSSSQLKTVEGKCLSFGKKNAMLKPCSDNDDNQIIHMQKLNSTLLVIHDHQARNVMCYDTKFKKVKVFPIRRLVKNYSGNPGEVVEATRTRRKFECGIYEEAQGDGHVYLRFGNTGADYMVWRTNDMIVKAKDMFCSYQESQESQNVRHNRSKNSPRSRERRNRSDSMENRVSSEGSRNLENRVSSEGSRVGGRRVSGERRRTRTQQLERRSAEKRRIRQERRKLESLEKRHHRRPDSERRRRNHKKKRCRSRERAKFKQFMYYNRPPL